MTASQPNPATANHYHHITVEMHGDVWFVRLVGPFAEEPRINAMADELVRLVTDEGCRKLVLNLERLDYLFSVLLGRLEYVRRNLAERDGRLKLCNVSPLVREVFVKSKMADRFTFAPSVESAINEW